MISTAERAAIVLCGGKSRRMGQPKAWLPVGAETMLQRIVRILSGEVQEIIVVAAADQKLPDLPQQVIVVRDLHPDQGPLEGLATGLQSLDPSRTAYVTGCDVPRLQSLFVRFMFDVLRDEEIAVPATGEFRHPLAAVYRCRVLAVVQQLLSQGERRPRTLFQQVATRFVTSQELQCVDPELSSLDNLNTPEDYQRALQAIDSERRTGKSDGV